MGFFGRISVCAIVFFSTAYSAYAFARYRVAWRLCRSRLDVPRSVQLFHSRLARSDISEQFAMKCDPSNEMKRKKKSNNNDNNEVNDEEGGGAGSTVVTVPLLSCPVAFVDSLLFDANVRSVGSYLLGHGKQIRLSTKSLRCPELLERAAAILEKMSQPCADFDIVSPAEGATRPHQPSGLCENFPKGCVAPLVSGLLTSTAAETLFWARRGTFSSLLLGKPIADAADASRYVAAMTLTNPPKVRCGVVADAIEQLEFIWAAARAWIADRKYAALGFDHGVISLNFSLFILLDVSSPAGLSAFWARRARDEKSNAAEKEKKPCGLRTLSDVQQFYKLIEEFNSRVAKERLPVGVHFSVDGVWASEGGVLCVPDIAPAAAAAASSFFPARWFLLFPLLQWYKRRAAEKVEAQRGAIAQWLQQKIRNNNNNNSNSNNNNNNNNSINVVSGGCSAALMYSVVDETLTELCVGGGLLCAHELDRFVDSIFTPALFFALRISRVAAPRTGVCAGFGQSLPIPEVVFPQQLRSVSPRSTWIDEELETGVTIARNKGKKRNISGAAVIGVGDPVVFRPSRSGSLAELVNAYLLISDNGEVEQAMRTYRGEGLNIWA